MKKDSKEMLFEAMGKVNPELDKSWAIFKVSKGYGKCFVTSIENGQIHICDYRVKYSDSNVLKFSLEDAKKIIRKNIGISENIGVVNNSGIQKLFNWRIKFPDKYDENGNEMA